MNRHAAGFLTLLVLVAVIGTFFSVDLPAKISADTIRSIYYTSAELDALKSLKTAPSHSATWNNIKAWGDAHLGDTPIAQETSTDWYYWIQDADNIRRHIDTFTFLYDMTDNATYANAAVNWMVSAARWTAWGPPEAAGNDWSEARFARTFAYGFSALQDYMQPADKTIVQTAMTNNVNKLIAYLADYTGITSAPIDGQYYANQWATIAFGAGLSALAMPASANYTSWMAVVTNCAREYLNRCGNDGTQYEMMDYMVSPMSFLVPFVEAYSRAPGGTNYFTTYSSFFSNNAYTYIYLNYTLLGKDNWIPMGDDEPLLGHYVDHRYTNPLDDIVYPLANRFNDGYAQQYANTYCSQDLPASYMWKSPTVTSLSLSGLPTTRTFPNYGIVVMRQNWTMNCLAAVFKSGVSGSHAHPDQNSFTIVNNGQWITGNAGYMYGVEADTRMNNAIVVNDAIVRGAGAWSTTGGQIQEPGDFDDPYNVHAGTVGVIAESVTNNNYTYARGDAAAVYSGRSSDGYDYHNETWTGSEGGTVAINASSSSDTDTHHAAALTTADRNFLFMKNPNYFVVFDRLQAPTSSEFTFCFNGATQAISGNVITTGANQMNSIVVEPSSLSSTKTTYNVHKSWIVHLYDVLRFHAVTNSTTANFLTVMFPGSTTLPTTRVDQNNLQGAIITTGSGRDLVLFSKNGAPVNEYVELGGYYQSADGNPYAFNGTSVLASFSIYKVMRLVTASGANLPPVLSSIGNKSVSEQQLLQFTVSATDPNGNPLTYAAANLPSGASFTPATRIFSWTPSLGQAGTFPNVQFSVTDNGSLTDSENIMIIVTPNSRPVANARAVNTNEDTAVAILLTATDADGDNLTYSVVQNPGHGSLSGTAPNITYTPAANYNGSDNFTFKANDGKVDSNIATVTLTVNAVNDAPSFTKGSDQSVVINGGAQTVPGWATGISAGPADESSQIVNFIVGTNDTALFTAQPSIYNGTLTYTPAGTAGMATLTVWLHDSGGTASGGIDTSAPQSFNITVTAAFNNAPVAVNDTSYIVVRDGSLGVSAPGVLANDTDSDNDTLTASNVTSPSHGSLVFSSNGSFSYVHNGDAATSDTFTYKANDGKTDSDIATVIITINPPVDTQAPSVTVLSPNGGKKRKAGSQYDITWTAVDNVGVTSINISYSTDNGTSYNNIATGLTNSGSYLWTVPNTASTTCLIRVRASDAAGNTGQDTSNTVFGIYGTIPGDANDDFTVNAIDITKVERIILGLDLPSADADANGDGSVNVLDTTGIEQIIIGP